MDARIAHDDENILITPPHPQIAAQAITQLRKATEFLEDSTRIGSHRSHYLKYRRYVTLYSSAIFQSLVSLYASLLISQWPSFKRLSDAFPPPQGTATQLYAARVYISHWFLDLYTSNREAIKKLSPIAFAQHFQHELTVYSIEYDRYLTLLNAAIRPTHVKGIIEDALYIPLISATANWESDNPFTITNFTQNYDYFMGIVDIMKDKKNWNMSTIVTDTVGRPSWLFDWHEDACCAWFPAEGNYSADDVTIAYIIGEACTPKLAPRDTDDWTFFEDRNQIPNVNIANLQRTTGRRFYGSYEIRTVEYRPFEYPEITYKDANTQSKKRKTPSGGIVIGGPDQTGEASSSTTAEPNMQMTTTADTTTVMKQCYQYQIIDWTYYCRVVIEIDSHTRSGALKTIVMS